MVSTDIDQSLSEVIAPGAHAAQARSNAPLFILSFVFLLFVLLVNGWQEWRNSIENYQADAKRTVNDYVMQSSIVLKAGIHANRIFIRSYGESLTAFALQPNTINSEELRQHIAAAIFNYTGFFVFSNENVLLNHDGELLHDNEPEAIKTILSQPDKQTQIFSLRFGEQGGYYIATPFSTPVGQLVLVTRRSFSNLSALIFRGGFPGYELLSVNRETHEIAIREQYYSDSSVPKFMTQEEQENILFQAPLIGSPWNIVTLPKEGYRTSLLLSTARDPLIFLTVFALMLFALWRYLKIKNAELQHIHLDRFIIQRRADRVLRAISEALISTDEQGNIKYINPQALKLFGYETENDVLEKHVSSIGRIEGALWNQTTSYETHSETAEHPKLNFNTRILEQNVRRVREGKRTLGYVWLLRDVTLEEQSKHALEVSRSRYRALFEEVGVPHCLLDLSAFNGHFHSLRIASVNDALLSIGNFEDEKSFKTFLQEKQETWTEFSDFIRRSIDLKMTNSEYELEVVLPSGNNCHLWINLSLHSGIKNQALITIFDVTERKQALQKIEEREAFWQYVMNSLPDTVYVVDIDDDHIHSTCYKNNDITMLLGYEKKSHEIVPNWFEYVTPEGLADLQAFMQRMRYAKAGTTHEHTTRLKHAQGHIVTIKFRNTPLVFDDNGEVTQYIGIGRDISEDANNQNRIAESERRYRLLAENMSDIVWETDTNVDFKFISSSIKRVLGHDSEDLLDLGPYAIFQESELRELMKETYKSIRFHKLVDYAEPAPIIRKDLMATHKNGHKILVEIKASLIWDEYKQLTGVLGVCRDVTEARNIEQQLLLASKVFENSSEAILITDNQLNIVKVNRAFTKITNYQSSEVIGKNPELLLNTGESNRDFFEQVGEHLVIDGYWQGEIQYRRKQGDIRTAWAGVSAIRDEQQEVQSLIMIMSDISDRKATEDRIHYLAFYDPLTQLPNRSQMLERLEAMLTKARQQNLWIGVLFIDLDRFKPINDSMGHPAGDRLLQLVAERLKNSVKSDDLVCRMSGDEFTIAFMESGDEASVTSTAITIGDRVLEALHRPFGLSSRDVFISASIGISIFPKDGQTVIELLKNADLAMYHAKNMGRDNLKFFTASMNRKAVQRLELENDLRQALARQEMEVYYQPQYCTKTRAIVGVEALLRWHHPTQGVIEPSVFIPIIEDTGMIVPLGEWVLKQACTHFVHWKTASKGNLLRMAVNVSGRQFGSDDFLAMVTRTLSETNMKATELELELTESILMDDVTHTLSILKELRKLGVKTAIDDFGTGYSSLNYLKQFPVDTLKIDRSFIQNLPHNDDDAQISRTIIAMGHNLGVGIVAEGVETEAQYNFLKAEHCEEVQGFYFSHPMPESELMTLFGAH